MAMETRLDIKHTFKQAGSLLQQNKFIEAETVLVAALKSCPNDPNLLRLLGLSLLKQGRAEEAEKRLTHVTRLAPEFAQAHEDLAEAFYTQGKLDEAIKSFRTALKHCHEICVHERHLFLTSTGFDSVLAFDLEQEKFSWGLYVKTDGVRFNPVRFDPNGDDGPLMLNKLHLNSIFCDDGGMYISGMRTNALLNYSGKAIGVLATLPDGVHNARPFKNGVLFNDTQSNVVRFITSETQQAFPVPRYSPEKLTHKNLDDTRIARQGFGRGLCIVSDTEIATGSSPSTISIHNLTEEKTTKVINLSLDIRNAIHGLEVWPFELLGLPSDRA